jgi:hypothetical protein
MEKAILLLNCLDCDDIVRALDNGAERFCMCKKASIALKPSDGSLRVTTGPARVLAIPYEEYDGAVPDEYKRWYVVRDPRPMGSPRS